MTGDRIDFSRNGKKIYLEEGKSFKKVKKDLKPLEPIFQEIDKLGNKEGKVDGKETELYRLLRGKLGKYISEDAMMQLVDEFKKSGLTVEEFLRKEVEPAKVETPVVEEQVAVSAVEQSQVEEAPAEEVTEPDNSDEIAEVIINNLRQKAEAEIELERLKKLSEDKKSSRRAFNDMIQNLRMKIAGEEEKLKAEYGKIYTIQKGDSFYRIAERSLKEENGGKKPTPQEVNKRIAEIALVNNINDIYKTIHPGDTIIIKGVSTEAQAEKTPVAKDEDGQSVSEQEQATPEITKSFEVVESQIDEKAWTEEAVEGEENIKKYTKTEGEGENAVTKTRYRYSTTSMTLEADTLEELKELKKPFDKEIKTAPENETPEAATARKAENLATLKERVETYPSIEVLTDVIAKLKDETLTDKTSDEFKALVKSLVLTQNADVIHELARNGDSTDNTLFENDKVALETLATIHKELRDKEKAGVKLTDEEQKIIYECSWSLHYSIPEDTAHGVVAKSEKLVNRGIVYVYEAEGYNADSPELLDEFVKKLKAADTDEKKTALFKEYANTDDIGLVRALVKHADDLKASKEDVLTLINKNDIVAISNLEYTPADADKDDFNNAVKDRIVDIYLKLDKGNPANARFLDTVYEKIDATNMTDEEKSALKNQILETYFVVETSKDEKGNEVKTYKFEPSRRYTYSEMKDLIVNCDKDMKKAIVDSIKLEDVGRYEYTASVEGSVSSEIIVAKYAEFVDKMETKEEVLDFVSNKVDYYSAIPFDKIMEKFPDDPEVMQSLLINFVYQYSTISDENKLKLAKFFTQTDENGNVTFDRSKLPEGVPMENFVHLLPEDCSGEEVAKIARAVIKTLDKNDFGTLCDMEKKAPDAARAKLAEMVEKYQKDSDFIKKVLTECDESVLPYDKLRDLNVNENGYNDEIKQLLFEKCYKGRIERTDWDKALAKGVELGLLNKVTDNRYQIGDVLYCTDWHYIGADGKSGTEDDIMSPSKVSYQGYERGIEMYKQLKGAGSGDIAAMLRGTEDPYKNYVTKDNITGILTAFMDCSKKEGIMEFIANEWRLSKGAKPGKALCNRIPKALMRKAAELGLKNTDEYKALKTYFGADDNFNFTKNDEAGVRYSPADARALDAMISALYRKILLE